MENQLDLFDRNNTVIYSKNSDEITSLELMEQINIFRKAEGKSNLQHKHLLDSIRDEFEEEIVTAEISALTYRSGTGKGYTMYSLKLEQAKQLLARESKIVRKSVFQYINKIEQEIKNTQAVKDLPQNYPDALEALAVTARAKMLAEAKLLEQKPIVTTHEAMKKKGHNMRLSSFFQSLTIKDPSKDFKIIGRNTMFKLLRSMGYIQNNNALPFQKYIDKGYFVVNGISKNDTMRAYAMITPDGMIWLKSMLAKRGYVSMK